MQCLFNTNIKMSLLSEYNSFSKMKETNNTKKFTALLNGMEECNEEEQMQKIKEMNEMVDHMNEEEFEFVFTEEPFNKLDKMIEEKKLSMENTILLLKHVGCLKILKNMQIYCFIYSKLRRRFEEMIIEEEGKKEEKNERLLVDLCECLALLNISILTDELLSIIMPCLLKVASKKGETEEAQKEVEITLLALSNIGSYNAPKELHLNVIKTIIEHHQEHHNLTRLAYQSAWQFLMNRFYWDKSLEEVIVKELHFAREAARELEDLSKCIDWNRNEEENGRIEVHIIRRWLYNIDNYLTSCELWNEEIAGLINCIVQMIRESRDNHKDICNRCLDSLRCAAENRNVEIDDLLKSGAIDAVMEEIHKSTMDDIMIYAFLVFFELISIRLKSKMDNKTDEAKSKATKRKVAEKMEEEGCEDFVISFHRLWSNFFKTKKKKERNKKE
eukprot:MONOS_8228.1-p1 / transcript=MONOS_8228.1 / gene=MONOS_8228 / organism=Monocercomonoides_exilis_PA203 / gene_product=unspecified product / transcript_product=unspecified product / location=Mono_scaffold00304:46765-48536(-) / protein_length=444 / sequence_SO=supercontig / SO=protein_coding / is_pseudo=false